MNVRQIPNTINWAAGLFVAFAVAVFVMFAIEWADPSADGENPIFIASIVLVLILRKAWLLRKGRESARIAGIMTGTLVMFMSFIMIYVGVSDASDIKTLFEGRDLALLLILPATGIGAIAAIILLLHGSSRNFTLGEDGRPEVPGLGSFLRELFRRGIGELKDEN